MFWIHFTQDDRVRKTWFPMTLSNVPVWNCIKERASHTWMGAWPPESTVPAPAGLPEPEGDRFHPGVGWSLSPWLTVCISANHENRLHVAPGLSPVLDLTTIFQFVSPTFAKWPMTLSQIPASPSLQSPHSENPSQLNCCILNIQGPTHPDLAPCHVEIRSDPGGFFATWGKLQRHSCPTGRRGQRLVHKDEKSPTLLTEHPVFYLTWWLQKQQAYNTHSLPPNKKQLLRCSAPHFIWHLLIFTTIWWPWCYYYLYFIDKNTEPQKV